MATSKVIVFDNERQHPASFTLSETREGAEEYRFSGRLETDLAETLSLTGPVMFSLACRDKNVIVDFVFPSTELMRFVVVPGCPLVMEMPQDAGDNYPTTVSVVPTGSYAVIDLLMYTSTPASAEEFIWLRSGYGVEAITVAGELKVNTWRDTRDTALAKSVWQASSALKVGYARDASFNNEYALSFPYEDTQQMSYLGSDLDDLPANDYTVMIVAYVNDDDSAEANRHKILWAPELGGTLVSVDGGYVPTIMMRPENLSGANISQLCPRDQEIGEKPTVFIVENRISEQTITLYCQGVSETFDTSTIAGNGGALNKFTIGGVIAEDTFPFPAWGPQLFKGKIADIRVHNRLLTATEKADYLSYAATTYGVGDTPVPVFPWTNEARAYFRACRGFENPSALEPTKLYRWYDTTVAYSDILYWERLLGSDGPDITTSNTFDGLRVVSFDGNQRMVTYGATPSQYELLGGQADFTLGIVFRSDVAAPGDLANPTVLLSSKKSTASTTAGTIFYWVAPGYSADDLFCQIRESDGVTQLFAAGLTVSPGDGAAAVLSFDAGVEGRYLLQGEINDQTTSGTAGTSTLPSLGGAVTGDSASNLFTGQVVEVFWLARKATDQELADFREYLTYRYGLPNP